MKRYRSEARAIKRAERLRKSFGIWTCVSRRDNDGDVYWVLGFDPDLVELIS
jgi:hypothetical protein